ncbi:hypothetical protein HYS97_01830 [Candidatus Daviesbacteria bacterium]|nr:hypothetical protein [Candidatus Daviesbacteria bacterium]
MAKKTAQKKEELKTKEKKHQEKSNSERTDHEEIAPLEKDQTKVANTQETPGEKTPIPKENTSSFIEKEISTQTFIISHTMLFIISLVFLGGLYFILNQDFRDSVIKNYQPVTRRPTSINLSLKNPEDEILTHDKNLVITGSTIPMAALIISNLSDDKNFGFEADKNGDFTQIIELSPLLNELSVTAFDNDGSSKTETRTVFFSEEELEE